MNSNPEGPAEGQAPPPEPPPGSPYGGQPVPPESPQQTQPPGMPYGAPQAAPYGTPQATPYGAPPMAPYGAPTLAPKKPGNGLAVAGFVLGLLGFLGSFVPVLNIGGIIMGIVGLVLAIVGLSKAKNTGTGKGLALAGVILGALAVVIGIVINVAFASVFKDAVDDATGTTVVAPGGSGASADAGLGSTRDNPAPLGSAVTGDGWTVTINSVAKVEEDSFGSKAAEGSVLLLVNLTATYDGDDPQGSTPWASVNFVTADGTTVDSLDASTLFVAEDSFDSMTTLYAGGSTAGDRILEVPADGWEQGVLAVSPDMLSDDTFVAVK